MDHSNSSCSWEFSPENQKFDFCNVERMQNYVDEHLPGKKFSENYNCNLHYGMDHVQVYFPSGAEQAPKGPAPARCS